MFFVLPYTSTQLRLCDYWIYAKKCPSVQELQWQGRRKDTILIIINFTRNFYNKSTTSAEKSAGPILLHPDSQQPNKTMYSRVKNI